MPGGTAKGKNHMRLCGATQMKLHCTASQAEASQEYCGGVRVC